MAPSTGTCYYMFMLSQRLDATEAEKSLHELARKIGQFADSQAIVTPTQVVYYLSQQRGSALLQVIPSAASADVRKRWVPKVAAVTREAVAKGKRVNKSAVARAWRYGAYVYVERLWLEVTHAAWGRVAPSTAPAKAAELAGYRRVQAHAAAERKARVRAAAAPPRPPTSHKPRAPRKAGGRAWTGLDVMAYGVRARERDRRWYDIQKGRRSSGSRAEPRFTEQSNPIEVFIGREKIG